MNKKKFLLPSVFLAITIIAYIVASVLFCYTTKPEVQTGEFPFSVTYKYKGEVKTFSGVYKCKFSGSKTILNEHHRYWEGEAVIDNPAGFEHDHIIDQQENVMSLAIQEDIDAGYFMGDPLYKNSYAESGREGPEPYIEYFEYKNNIETTDENRDEIMQKIGFEILDYSYAEPIENSFSFSGVKYEADNVTIFDAILFVFLLLCLIFVRRDKEYKYTSFDKIGICLNFIVGIITLPFITFICILFDLNGSGESILCQIAYNIPPVAILCLALSIVFRRKGFSKTGFFVQFGGGFLFALLLLLDSVILF